MLTARATYRILLTGIALLCCHMAVGQIQPPGAPPNLNNPQNQRDSNQFKQSNTTEWKNETARIYYRQLYSDKVYIPDTAIHTFHRRRVNQPWRDIGNSGSAARNLLFTPEDRTGPTLGYHVFAPYRFDVDSLNYYNTNRAYSVFQYQLGGKQEQLAGIMHTQNIRPNWNVAIGYRKINSPGNYNIQRTNHDNANLSTHYQSRNLHYELYGGVVYNKEQQDENGGILYDSLLTDPAFNDKRTLRVRFQNDGFGNVGNTRRSSVGNTMRDYAVMLQHGYTWGRIDTVYNEDSTRFSFELTPRFSITHRFEMSGERHTYKDLRPDSLRYVDFFNYAFVGNGSDSVHSRQEWFFVDNRFALNGFLGKQSNQLQFSAGLGNRIDKFRTAYVTGDDRYNITSNYIIASLKKEALLQGKWFYGATLQSYLTGDAAGNTALQANVGKEIGTLGSISAGASQNINNAPYNYTTYYNQFDTITRSFAKESVTQIYGLLQSDRLKFTAGIRNYLVNNYIYLNAQQLPDQYATTFNLTQVWLRKAFTWRIWILDNEITYQQPTTGAPVNIPQLLGRHQLSLEAPVFKKALWIATGVEVRYHSSYTPAGYSPFFNRFYYQNTYTVSNTPEASFFFNFRIKRFRAYLMADQLQQLFGNSTVIAPGYAAQNFMIRFGFHWTLIN